VNAKENCMMSC